MSKGMAIELQSESQTIIEELKHLLWDSPQVSDELIPDLLHYQVFSHCHQNQLRTCR